jgi:hypothetical protein
MIPISAIVHQVMITLATGSYRRSPYRLTAWFLALRMD